MAWDADKYVQGNYFQTSVNEFFSNEYELDLQGIVLDVGCGDGQYLHQLATHFKKAKIVGIDTSESMIQYAEKHYSRANLAFLLQNIEQEILKDRYNTVISFWCLHWTDLSQSLPNIYRTLKRDGQFYAVLSSLSDNSVFQVWEKLTHHERYGELARSYQHALEANRDYYFNLLKLMVRIPFRNVKSELRTLQIPLPNLRHFQNLLITLPFMQRVPKEQQEPLLKTMLKVYEEICEQKYAGALFYETRPLFLKALK